MICFKKLSFFTKILPFSHHLKKQELEDENDEFSGTLLTFAKQIVSADDNFVLLITKITTFLGKRNKLCCLMANTLPDESFFR